jgi:hypothetical protein
MRLPAPKKAPFTLLEVVACSLIILILFDIGLPQVLIRKYKCHQIKEAYLAQISTQGLVAPANHPNSIALRGYGLCGERLLPSRIEVTTGTGETFDYSITGIPKTRWWTTQYSFKPTPSNPATFQP